MNFSNFILGHVPKLPLLKRSHKHGPIQAPASLEWLLQTPTAMLIEGVEAFTGAPVVGEIVLDVSEGIDVENFSAALYLHRCHKRPLHSGCLGCTHDYLELKRWSYINSSLTLAGGKYSFAFSVRLNNDLPSLLDTPLVAFTYELRAELKLTSGKLMSWEKNLDVRRSLCGPGILYDIPLSFPEARMAACLSMKRVIEPDGTNTVRLSLHEMKRQSGGGTFAWEVSRMEWKFEETVEATVGPCASHLGNGENGADGRRQTVTHSLAKGRIRSGWRSGQGVHGLFSTVEFEYGPISTISAKRETTYACDETIRSTLRVSHALVVEVSLMTATWMLDEPTGSVSSNNSRTIRIRRPVVLTERRDDVESVEETLPAYTDAQVDPPAYT